jgi:hypothetical protein
MQGDPCASPENIPYRRMFSMKFRAEAPLSPDKPNKKLNFLININYAWMKMGEAWLAWPCRTGN